MLSFFRTNQQIANLFLIIYTLLLRGSVFFVFPEGSIASGGVFSKSLFSIISQESLFSFLFASFLIFLQGAVINLIVAQFRISSEVSLLPGVFFILLASAIPEFLFLSPALIANSFLILVLLELFAVYKKYQPAGNIYNTGFWVGLASLFYVPDLFFIILVLVGLGSLKAFKFKERIVVLTGFITPYILTGVYFFWTDRFSEFLQSQFTAQFGFLSFQNTSDNEYIFKLIFFSLLLLFVIISYNRYMLKKKIQSQKYISILYWFLYLAGFSAIFTHSLELGHLIVLTPALGILLSFSFLRMSKPLAEAIHFLLFVAVIIFQFKVFWMV